MRTRFVIGDFTLSMESAKRGGVSRGIHMLTSLSGLYEVCLDSVRETEQAPSQHASKPASQDICAIASAIAQCELPQFEESDCGAKSDQQISFADIAQRQKTVFAFRIWL